MARSWTILLMVSTFAWSSACGDNAGNEGFSPSQNAGWIDASTHSNTPQDTSPKDTAPHDTNPAPSEDAAPHEDTTTPRDTSVPEDLPPDTPPRSHEAQVIYLVLPDRFANGSTDNDLAGTPACFDPNHPRKFHGGDLEGLRQNLTYLEQLGINTIWTTPLYKQVGEVGESCGYHGYWADFSEPDDGAIEPKLGDEATLDSLIADMNTRNMGLIFDMVVNHAGYNADLTRQHPAWFHGSNCTELGNPDIFCGLAGLPDFAQENPEVAAYLNTMSASWLKRYPVAGIRMDTVKHVPLDYLKEDWIPAVRDATDHPLFVVGEYLDGSGLGLFDPYLESGFDSMFNFRLRDALVATLAKGEPVTLLADRVQETMRHFGTDQALRMTNLLDNHDVPRFTHELTGDTTARAARYHLALIALMTLPGIPQLYYGNELGMEGARDPDNRRGMPDWAWTPDTHPSNAEGFVGNPAETFALTRNLTHLRATFPALAQGDFFEIWRPSDNDAPSLYAFLRIAPTPNDAHLLVLINTGTQTTGQVTIPIEEHAFLAPELKQALTNGTVLTDQLERTSLRQLTVEEGQLMIRLPALSAAIMRIEP